MPNSVGLVPIKHIACSVADDIKLLRAILLNSKHISSNFMKGSNLRCALLACQKVVLLHSCRCARRLGRESAWKEKSLSMPIEPLRHSFLIGEIVVSLDH